MGQFLGELIPRGLTGEPLEVVCVGGGSGLLAALSMDLPGRPVAMMLGLLKSAVTMFPCFQMLWLVAWDRRDVGPEGAQTAGAVRCRIAS